MVIMAQGHISHLKEQLLLRRNLKLLKPRLKLI
jgi:hypothetical protein